MKKHSFILLILSILMVIGCGKTKLNNQWTNSSIKIDGNSDDWDNKELQYFEKQNLMIGSVNDAENLYLMFRFNDRQLAHKIQEMGVTLWLDKTAKKEKTYGINYVGSTQLHTVVIPKDDNFNRPESSDKRFSQTSGERGNRRPGRDNAPIQKLIKRLKTNLPGPGKIWLIENENEKELVENQLSGVSAGSSYQDRMYCFEFRFPLPLGIKKNKISMGIEFGGLSDEDLNEIQNEMSKGPGGDMGRSGGGMGGRPGGGMGRPGGGRGGRPGGGMGGPGGGPGGMMGGPGVQKNDPSDMFKKQEIWMDIILAENK